MGARLPAGVSRIESVVAAVCPEPAHPLAAPLRVWCQARPFLAFAEANTSKLRKKVREAAGEEAGADLLAELAVAAWLLRDAGITLTYEPLKAVGGRGPDFALVTPNGTTNYVEVARLRSGGMQEFAYKLARVLADKVGQFQPGAANVLAVMLPAGADPDGLAPAALRLLARAAQGDALPAVSAGRAQEFERRRPRLSGVLLLGAGEPPGVTYWAHAGARVAVPAAVSRGWPSAP